ncbi:hypothetical protein CROQUDRAFT_91682 [Cronartium quercuum f. sp. fusiforme G11]|uniref:Uncharacterized protein n=1 Tax=Cronartium quercuum f. sp. fusiforme G11 TaxID=708437 RepID=A0A9P6NN81_9BASI|nr:hypothetical protein CROQUDRAFT_91682 [Cronartium quercuum f. sp. fusiforme G11]
MKLDDLVLVPLNGKRWFLARGQILHKEIMSKSAGFTLRVEFENSKLYKHQTSFTNKCPDEELLLFVHQSKVRVLENFCGNSRPQQSPSSQ